jgi:hypothetical protein
VLRSCAALLVTVAAGFAPARAERVVAVAPLSTLGAEDTSAATRKIAAQLERAITTLGARVVTSNQVADAIKRAKKPQLKACEGEATCLAELGQLVGAQYVIAGQVGGLGDSRVVYLSVTDAANAKELRSTTLAVGARDDANAAEGAVIRLLDPGNYRGELRFAIDVEGATVYVNGSKVTLADRRVALPVGTQAVRVTHPQYRDFVRFIDVHYGQTVEVPVAMTQFPIVERDVQGKPIDRDRIEYVDPPLYRRWYVVGPAAVGLAIVTGIVVGVLVHDLPDAPCRKVGGEPC